MKSGVRTLNKQAQVLGLSRSTAWTVLTAQHKSSGISATIISRILASQELPPLVRSVIVKYSEEKTAGLYGGSVRQRRLFAARLSNAGLSFDVRSAAPMLLDASAGREVKASRGW